MEGSNIVEFLKTRKFWGPLITLAVNVIVWALPAVLPSLEVTPELIGIVTMFLWGIASVVVFGDVRYDWINAEGERPNG